MNRNSCPLEIARIGANPFLNRLYPASITLELYSKVLALGAFASNHLNKCDTFFGCGAKVAVGASGKPHRKEHMHRRTHDTMLGLLGAAHTTPNIRRSLILNNHA